MNDLRLKSFPGTKEQLAKNKAVDLILPELERSKYVIATLYDILTWKLAYYPALLLAIVNGVFILIWFTNISNLTLISLLFLSVILIDAISPILTDRYYADQIWDVEKRQKLIAFSNGLYECYNFFLSYYAFLMCLRKRSPYLLTLFILIKFVLALWIGSFNNFIICYIKASIFILIPGLYHRNVHNQIYSLFHLSNNSRSE